MDAWLSDYRRVGGRRRYRLVDGGCWFGAVVLWWVDGRWTGGQCRVGGRASAGRLDGW